MIKKYKGKYKDVNNTFFKIENNIIGNIYIYCKKGVLEWNKEDHDYYLYVSDGILANSYSIKLIRIMRCGDGGNNLGRFDIFTEITKEEFISGYNEYSNKIKENLI